MRIAAETPIATQLIRKLEGLAAAIGQLNQHAILARCEFECYKRRLVRGARSSGHGLLLDWIHVRKINLVSRAGHDLSGGAMLPSSRR